MCKEQKAKELGWTSFWKSCFNSSQVETTHLQTDTCAPKADIYDQYSEKKSTEFLPRQWHDTHVEIDNATFSFSQNFILLQVTGGLLSLQYKILPDFKLEDPENNS